MTRDTDYDELDLDESPEIPRAETGVRILLSVMFFVIARIVEAGLGVLIVFELGFALVTERRPSGAVRRVANHALSYLVEITRYLTYNDEAAPFPFRDFPPELDLTTPRVEPGDRD